MRRLRGLWVLCAALLGATVACAGETASDPFAQVAKAYLVEIDGSLVWHKNAQQKLPPASLTKLMTALLVVDALGIDTPVVVDTEAARETGSALGMHRGERWTVKDLLAATLIASANDACRALADHVAGDQAHFVSRMNRRALQMGLRNTHFANACGHDAPGHYSSASDLRVLAHALMQNPVLAQLVAQPQAQITSLSGERSFVFGNKNALIDRYEGTLGIKTGTTPQAGKCLVVQARRGAHTVLLVLLAGKDRWWDATDILDIAFARANAPH
jgi:D-alanyl-D-alanine carboxypeptidase (penicillin-binding protein 5/6)